MCSPSKASVAPEAVLCRRLYLLARNIALLIYNKWYHYYSDISIKYIGFVPTVFPPP